MNLSLPISIAFAGLDAAALGLRASTRPDDRGPEVRELLTWSRRMGAEAVQLNAATPGVRPRDLDRSARRDLAATLRREGLSCSGLDLWIPPEHFADPLHADRAVASVLGALDLAQDLAALAGGSVVSSRPAQSGIVSLALPADVRDDVLGTLSTRAHARGAVIADHRWPPQDDGPVALAVGIDPAVVLAANADPAAAAARLGPRVASARVCDLSRGVAGVAGSRMAVSELGRGRLDVLSYVISLTTAGYSRAAVIDCRGLPDPASAVTAAMTALRQSMAQPIS